MENEFYIIDRIENDILVCEKYDGTIVDIGIDKLEGNEAKEGMVLNKKGNKYYFNEAETEKRKKEIEKFMEEMWK